MAESRSEVQGISPRIKLRRKLAVVPALALLLELYWAFARQPSYFWQWAASIFGVLLCFVIYVLCRNDSPPPPEEPDFPQKNIILFSDGTGNSSAKIFKTNVWRLYQALDLGPTTVATGQQVAAYYNGVGTSNFKPLQILGGIFGIGLKRNVLELYRFVCRNYHEKIGKDEKGDPVEIKDKIYAFGFSRGAFTIRVLVALIASEGIVTYDDERDLAHKTAAAYRHHLSGNKDNVPYLTLLLRAVIKPLIWLYDWLVWGKHYRQSENLQTCIEFVGVWDTVAAYGGPISELTRAIDKWIYPLSMPNYELSEKVKCARHALALDDERDSFQPLVWDEVHEAALVKRYDETGGKEGVPADRLKQVWFAGMHSDVGGGYPDESLSYIPLLWMIDELGERLRFVPSERDRYVALANAFAPIHDSREGVAAYFRYQPRKIDALMHYDGEDGQAMMRRTAQLRDPVYSRKDGKWRGLLTCCCVHESVFVRIAAGTDNYAPITLPEHFRIEPAKSGSHIGNPNYALLSNEVETILDRDAEPRALAQEAIWDWVWWRRITYFLTFLISLALATFPWWGARVPGLNITVDHRWALRTPIGWMEPFIPGFLKPWFQAFAESTIVFSLFVIAILACLAISQWQERNLRDLTRLVWWDAMNKDRQPAERRITFVQKFRSSGWYQLPFHVFKWYFLPFIFGVSMLLLLLYVTLIGIAQARLVYLEHEVFCATKMEPNKKNGGGEGFFLDVREPCNATGMKVEAKTTYQLDIAMSDGWRGGLGFASKPDGFSASEQFAMDRDLRSEQGTPGYVGAKTVGALEPWFNAAQLNLGAPFRRVVEAKWLQVLVEVRDTNSARTALQVECVALQARPGGVFTGTFRPTQNGDAFIFVNDAVLPWRSPDALYKANEGEAYARITRLKKQPDSMIKEKDASCTEVTRGKG